MIGGMAAFLRGAWDLGGRALKSAGAWLRRPRDWWRFTAVCLALVCVGFSFAFTDAKREIVLVREQCNTRVVTIEREAEQAVTAAATTRQSLLHCRTRLEEEVGKAARARELEREATEAAAATAAQAKRDREAWQRTYRERPVTCQTALEAMEAACPSLEEY